MRTTDLASIEAMIASTVSAAISQVLSAQQAPKTKTPAPKADTSSARSEAFRRIRNGEKGVKIPKANAPKAEAKATPKASTFVSKTQKAHAIGAISHLRCGKSGISPIPTVPGTYTFSGMAWICHYSAGAKTPRQGVFEHAGHKYSYTCPGVAGQLSTLTVA